MDERKMFKFYKSYYEVYMELAPNDKILFMDALLNKQFFNIEPHNLSGMAKFAYISQKQNIDSQLNGFIDKTGFKFDNVIEIDYKVVNAIEPPTIPPIEPPKQDPIIQCKEKKSNEKKSNFIYNQFFDSELEKLKTENLKTKLTENYGSLIKFIYGQNTTGEVLNGVLKIKKQLTFKEFSKLMESTDFEKIRLKLYSIENNPKYQKYSSLYMTLINWTKRDIK